MLLTQTEENYLKAIYFLSHKDHVCQTSTNAVATKLGLKPATVTSMLIKLKERELIDYEKYGKIVLSPQGRRLALQIVRKHRIWELFLFSKLDFSWDEVHQIAEQLEHIDSEKLIDRLDKFLGYPEFDPHGDPIPDAHGNMAAINRQLLSEAGTDKIYQVVGIKEKSDVFLRYLSDMQIGLDTKIVILSKIDFDNSFVILINEKTYTVSQKVTDNIWISNS